MPALTRLAIEIAVAAAALGGAFAAGHVGGVDVGRAQVQRRWDAERGLQLDAAASAINAARTEAHRRTTAIEEIAHAAEQDTRQARADADAAAGAAERLRRRAAALAERCGGPASDPGTATGREAAASAGLVLADVLGRADETAGELAAAFDRAHAAGIACERGYDALRGGTP